jgi:16S rRNA G527 N7-methylase RsmG
MTAQKTADHAQARSIATTSVMTRATERKPWKKKTPVEIVLDQIEKVRDQVAAQEEALKTAKRQLQKLEEAKKLLESA